jgi:hypothetical protein
MIAPSTKQDIDEIGDILNVCLERIMRDDVPIESVIAGHPDLKETLRPPLEAAHWLLLQSQRLDPSPNFRLSSRLKIIYKIRNQTPIENLRGRHPIRLRHLSIIFPQ